MFRHTSYNFTERVRLSWKITFYFTEVSEVNEGHDQILRKIVFQAMRVKLELGLDGFVA